MDTPSGPASRRARWPETLGNFDLTVVYVPGKDQTVADCLISGVCPARKGMTNISAHGDEAETSEAKKIIDMGCMKEKEEEIFRRHCRRGSPWKKGEQSGRSTRPRGC